MNYNLNDTHMNKISLLNGLFNLIFVIAYSYLLNIFFVLLIAITMDVDLITRFSMIVLLPFPAISLLLFILRGGIIKSIFNKWDHNKIYNINKSSTNKLIFTLFYVLILVSIDARFSIFPLYVDLMSIIIMLSYMVIYYTFNPLLNEKGCSLIELEYLNQNMNNFLERPNWLLKLCSRIEKYLHINGFHISKDDLFYKMNKKIVESNKTDFSEIEEWLLMEPKDNTIIQKMEKIVPNLNLEQYKKVPWYRQIEQIPYKHFTIISITIILIMLAFIYMLNPQSNTEIIMKIAEIIAKIF